MQFPSLLTLPPARSAAKAFLVSFVDIGLLREYIYVEIMSSFPSRLLQAPLTDLWVPVVNFNVCSTHGRWCCSHRRAFEHAVQECRHLGEGQCADEQWSAQLTHASNLFGACSSCSSCHKIRPEILHHGDQSSIALLSSQGRRY